MLGTLFAATYTYFATLRLRTYLHAFQQEEYDNLRLLKWWREKRAFDRYFTLGLLIAIPFAFLQPPATLLIAALWALYRTRQEPDPTMSAKKVLILTPRARHTWYLAALLAVPAIIALTVLPRQPLLFLALAILLTQALPLFLILANLLLAPLHAWQNRRYLHQARTILTRLNPTVIGLTGSFGKTSTKSILNHILGNHLPTLATPGSVNTPLGIARVVREQLQPHHHYFIAEMGAYGPGSIARLCTLAPPQVSAITAVGHAHYERFKSLATVAAAKFEIAATASSSHPCILNADAIPDDLWQPRVAANPSGYRLVSTRKAVLRPGDYFIKAATQTPTGLTLTIEHTGKATVLTTPLFGNVQIGNIAVAFAIAAELGLPPAAIAASLATVKAAPHRLNIQHAGGHTTIDDSYNANPVGFATALETLTLIAHADAKKKRRRILITPGMVELGTAHGPEHARLGALAAQHADVILVINPARIPTFTSALEAAGHPDLRLLPSLAAARAWVQANGRADDVLLIANDLPDRYEAPWNL